MIPLGEKPSSPLELLSPFSLGLAFVPYFHLISGSSGSSGGVCSWYEETRLIARQLVDMFVVLSLKFLLVCHEAYGTQQDLLLQAENMLSLMILRLYTSLALLFQHLQPL